MYQRVPASVTTRGGSPTDNGDSVVTLDQVPRWSDAESRSSFGYDNEDPSFTNPFFPDPLTSPSEGESSSCGMVSRFPVDHEINSKIYLWRGNPWNLEVDAVVNSTNELLDEAHSSPGLHAAAGPGLAEECTTLGGCRTGMAKVTNAYDLPARRVIHTVGPKYAMKYHTAAENALSHCYRSCLELLIENGLQSIAMGCIYTESKNYPREPAAHVAIRTIRRFLEKQKNKITAVVFCTTTSTDTEIYKRLLPLYFPRDKHEEEVAISKLPADVGDENGETIIDERKIRIKPLPKKNIPRPSQPPADFPVIDVGLVRRNSSYLDSYLDPAFMSVIKDPDQRRKEQWKKTAQAQSGWNCAKMLGFGDLRGPPLSAAEECSLHSRYLAKANSLNLSEIAEMKIVYRGGVDSEGRPVMVVVGAHFLLRCLDLERFVLHVVKEFEPLIQKPYTIVYFHSAASLQVQPDLGWMQRLQQILTRKHQKNLHAIYVLHPNFHLKATIFALQVFVDKVTWKKVVYVDRLLQLFKYVPREQLTIPDFVFQHDLEVNGGKGLIVDPRTKYVYHRPADVQNAIENENYAVAAGLRDQVSKLEAESFAASARTLAYENAQYAFCLGQKARHKFFVVPEENLVAPEKPDLESFDHPYTSFLFYGMETPGDFILIKQLREKHNKPRQRVLPSGPLDFEIEGMELKSLWNSISVMYDLMALSSLVLLEISDVI
uniref:Appr-1-p processing enzyme family protein n=2 Tax=Populus TaxID=3689 RepID=A0A4U5Q003_POPAL|nr:appr-1-p processing enzyme family protein [Populus alba]